MPLDGLLKIAYLFGFLHGSMVAIAIDIYVRAHPDEDEEEMEKLVKSV